MTATAIATSNALADFDMCLALAQTSIDNQMEGAWRAWKRRQNFSDTISIFKRREAGTLVDSQYGLTAKFAPLSVSLNVPDGKSGQVLVNLQLESGKVVYYDEAREGKAEYPFNNWSISFVTDLAVRSVDLQILQQIDAAMHDAAQETIQSTGLPESVFSIEYLFLKLTDVDLMLSDNKNVRIPSGVPSSAREKALSSLNLLLQGEMGEYLFGTVVRRNRTEATPTFALTDFVFDISPNWSDASASTLNYLGEFSRRPLPNDLATARIKLRDPWLRPEQLDGRESMVSGIMAIARDVMFEKYLIPKVKNALMGFQFPPVADVSWGYTPDWTGPEPRREGFSWTFSESHSGRQVQDNVIYHVVELSQGYELKLLAQPGTNTMSIDGKVWSKVHYDGIPKWSAATDISGHTQWQYIEGFQPLSGSLTLSGSDIGTRFDLRSQLAYSLGQPVVEKNEVGGFSVVTNALGDAFKAVGIFANTPQELLTTAQSGLGAVLRDQMEKTLTRLDVDLNQQAFIPPGGGVFTFQNPRFSPAADLVLDVIYIQP